MIRNIIITAFRNFIRQPLFSIINVAGLALGIASSLLITMYVLNETSYDTFYPDADRIYRVNQTNIWSPEGGKTSSTSIPLAETLKNEFPEIESTLRINDPAELIVRHGDISFFEDGVLAVDSNFFHFYGIELIEGNAQNALSGKNKVVITSEVSQKFFNGDSPIGKLLLFGADRVPLEVTGVIGSLPENMHFRFDYLWNITTNPLIEEFEWSWFMTPLVTYVKIKPEVASDELEEKLKVIGPKYAPATLERFGIDYEEYVADKGGWNFYLQPVGDIYLHSAGIGNRIGATGDINYVYIFSIVGGFILILGCINFINLSTARASTRAKEIGIRKVLGSFKRQLIAQHLLESIFLCLIATLTGIVIMELLRVLLLESAIEIKFQWSKILPFILAFPILLGLVAGFYPALYLTTFRPAQVLKGNLQSGIRSSGFRSSLVVVQLSIAMIMLISTFIVHQQLSFLQNKNLGFDKERLLVVNHAGVLKEKIDVFRNKLRDQEIIESASISMGIPGRKVDQDLFTKFGEEEQISLNVFKVDPYYFKTLRLKIKFGRLFDENIADHTTVVLNETAALNFGWDPEKAVGKFINYSGDEMGKLEVIGVVKDFNFETLREPINPFVFMHYKSAMWGDERVVTIRYKQNRAGDVSEMIQNQWSEITDSPFSYSFLNEEFQGIYQTEQKTGNVFTMFTGLSIIIACIGLFGLSAYVIEKRAKEISIRKIFGAGIPNLLVMFSKEYLLLIGISFLIAVPICYFGIAMWLQNYAFHIDQSAVHYIFGAIVILISVMFTIGYKIFNVSSKNPTESLADH